MPAPTDSADEAQRTSAPASQRLLRIDVSAEMTPSDFIRGFTAAEALAILHALCSESKLRIAEVRSIVNAPGYDDV